MDLLTSVMKLIQAAATIGGGLWLLWGAITLGGALKNHDGPPIQSGIWQVVGGGVILAAALLFAQIDVSGLMGGTGG